MRNTIRVVTVFLTVFCLLFILIPSPGETQPRPKKKLIEVGWDVPYPDFVRDNIREMEKRPFDGVIFRTKEFNHVFDTTPWKESDIRPILDVLADIKWDKFTDNFIIVFAANKWDMDFFNDDHWKAITGNLKLVSKMAKAGRCTGVCFDPEPYGKNPWTYPGESYKGKSLGEVRAQVRKRGAQFITSLQSSMPDMRLLCFLGLSIYASIVDEPDEEVRNKLFNDYGLPRGYALFPAFINGMLEAAAPGVILIDGNELAYYYDSPKHYYRAYHLMKQRCQALVSVELRPKYVAQVQAGQALYVDEVTGRRWNKKTLGRYLTHEQRMRFFEHNTYYALTTTDEYVWMWSETMNWWKEPEPGANPISSEGGQPPGLEDAIISARKKYENNEPLGFDIEHMIRRAQTQKQVNE